MHGADTLTSGLRGDRSKPNSRRRGPREGPNPVQPDRSIEYQVKESIKQSLEHSKVDYLDTLLLHIYLEDDADNFIAWKGFETFVPHTIRSLGVSNFKLSQLKEL